MADNVSDIVKAAIQAQILAAFNEGPDLIEKLVKSALSKPVDSVTGATSGYSGDRVPYIDYLIGEEIRHATRDAVRKAVKDQAAMLEKYVGDRLNTESILQAFSKAIVGAVADEWRIHIQFQQEKR